MKQEVAWSDKKITRWPVSGPRLELNTSRIRSRSTNYSAAARHSAALLFHLSHKILVTSEKQRTLILETNVNRSVDTANELAECYKMESATVYFKRVQDQTRYFGSKITCFMQGLQVPSCGLHSINSVPSERDRKAKRD
jgi:hypothetical protein